MPSELQAVTPEEDNKDDLQIEIIGNPRPEIILAVKNEIPKTLSAMGYTGIERPLVHICEGIIVDKDGKEFAAGTYEERRFSGDQRGHIRISDHAIEHYMNKIKSPFLGESAQGRLVPIEAMSTYVAAHEAVHFVQDMRNTLGEERRSPEEAGYYDTPWEKEALTISKDRVLKEYGISKLLFSDIEGKIKLLGWFIKEFYLGPATYLYSKIKGKTRKI